MRGWRERREVSWLSMDMDTLWFGSLSGMESMGGWKSFYWGFVLMVLYCYRSDTVANLHCKIGSQAFEVDCLFESMTQGLLGKSTGNVDGYLMCAGCQVAPTV